MLIVFTTSYLFVFASASPSRPYDTATMLVSVLAGPLYISKLVSFGITVGYAGSNSIPSPNSSIPMTAVILAKWGLTMVVFASPTISGLIRTK